MDLKLRGPGEFFGVKQHGLPRLKIANIVEDYIILEKAREDAFEIVRNDPALSGKKVQNVRRYFLEHYKERYLLGSVG
jgi:ATP-dependent DNA helicase RecG